MDKMKWIGLFSIPLIASCIGCSSMPPVTEFSNTADPTVEITRSESNLNKAISNQVDVLSPTNFSSAKKYLEIAKTDKSKNKDQKDILHNVAVSNAYLEKAEEQARESSKIIPKVVIEREKVINAEAQKNFPIELESIDNDLKVATTAIEKKNESKAEKARYELEQRYKSLEIKALEKSKVGIVMAEPESLIKEKEEIKEPVAAKPPEMAKTENIQMEAQSRLDEQFRNASKMFSKNEAVVLKKEDGLLVRITGLSFSMNKTEIPANKIHLVSKVQTVIQNNLPCNVTVDGYTDTTGSEKTNLKISTERAQAVANYFIHNNIIQKDRITVHGLGSANPIASNKTLHGRILNRRVEVSISPIKSLTLK